MIYLAIYVIGMFVVLLYECLLQGEVFIYNMREIIIHAILWPVWIIFGLMWLILQIIN